MRLGIWLGCLGLAGTLLGYAQKPADKELAGDALIYAWLRHETAKVSRAPFANARSREDWERQRPELHQQFLYMLGLWPWPEKTPLQARVTGSLERDTFRVEKLYFQSRPGLYVTANLYIPKNLKPGEKLPAVLYVCGHSNRGRDGNKTAFQHHGIWFATHGYVCLIIDSLQLGEIAGIHHGTYREGRWWWHSAGYTPAGVECWNGIRALDYLCSRPEVDADRLAVTGISGGGAYTTWISAADERIKVSVPVSGFSDLETHVVDRVINGHCDCMFPHNVYRWDFSTILGLIAPRALLFLNSSNDTIFPMPGNERLRFKMHQFYGLFYPQPQSYFEFGVVPGPHQDHPELRLLAYRWINRHLKKDPRPVQEPEVPLFPGKELRVFPEDSDIPADARNRRIDETFVPRAQVHAPEKSEDWPKWHAQLLDQLRERVFTDWPQPVPAAQVLKENKDTGELILATDDVMMVVVHRLTSPKKAKRQLLVVLGPEDEENKLPTWARNCVGAEDEVFLLSPRGCGRFAWTQRNPPNYVERAHALLGRTVDQMRVWDIQAVARWLHEHGEDSLPLAVVGRGTMAVNCAYAAIAEGAISEIILVEPTTSHLQGPHYLNVLRVLDVPVALALLAPRPLTIYGAGPESFQVTQQVYERAKASERLRFLK
ncbi:MAG: prolyl oligopeptidase family serine peptidase [Gemmatales bacterium]|nr:prolyl oligopeptidase family serine peptidase [Gemmatales bacterium]MCS7159232.1 prolyl oligopeptidase family serine peptidase [Gemmatales bacterium]MDW8174432.1 prolyl oligopeptidase family serine peptidase [Gemmatales bacterium]MDW8222345.1 prolyl oligopeptidase family serine peptidase [Gemmatales bacterium]